MDVEPQRLEDCSVFTRHSASGNVTPIPSASSFFFVHDPAADDGDENVRIGDAIALQVFQDVEG
jgi:hypothetical protein